MHAVYCFLTNAEPLEEFRDCVSSGSFPLDENNWHQEMCAVMKTGEVRLYCPKDDWRGRDWLGEKINALPVEERWASAVAFAESCVAWEADQAMRMLLGNYQESAAIALDVAAPALRATLQRRAKKAEAWTLNLVARSIAQLENREGPFSRDFTDAYASLRAIALTDKTLEDADIGILFVDIHT
jgi:hypothetical protein